MFECPDHSSDSEFKGLRGVGAKRIDSSGLADIDQRGLLLLAFPLMVSNGLQVVLNLIDLCFLGRISTQAVAAVGAVQWFIVVVLLMLGCAGTAIQATVARAYGARCYTRVSNAVWTALWVTLFTAPIAVVLAVLGRIVLAPFGLDPQIEALAVDFWFPRILGSPLSAAGVVAFGYFNGIGRLKLTLAVSAAAVLVDGVFNQVLIFRLGWGIAGSAWATNIAQVVGLVFAAAVFLGRHDSQKYKSYLTWRPNSGRIWRQWRIGALMTLLPVSDILGLAIFQMMQVRLGPVSGAATQLTTVLTSVGYIPGVGLALVGTTLVAHSLGSGDRRLAMQLGSRVILLTACITGSIGVLLAFAGPWLLPMFVTAHDSTTAAVVELSTRLLWLAAGYQFFDGLNLASALCLRAAGDIYVPARLVFVWSWVIFVPLAHSFTFSKNVGWVNFLPQFGWGSIGGWVALLIYMMLLGSTLSLRWYVGAWVKKGSTGCSN